MNEKQIELNHIFAYVLPFFLNFQIVHNVHLEPFRVMRKRSIDQKLRIHLVYDESLSFLPNDKKNLIKVKKKLIICCFCFNFWIHVTIKYQPC